MFARIVCLCAFICLCVCCCSKDNKLAIFKVVGNVSELEKVVAAQTEVDAAEVVPSHTAMAHTRYMSCP